VKIEVKQVDDNLTWLYYENQYLYVELSYFLNYGLTLFDSVAHFRKAAPATRQLVPTTSRTQERGISFVWWHRHQVSDQKGSVVIDFIYGSLNV